MIIITQKSSLTTFRFYLSVFFSGRLRRVPAFRPFDWNELLASPEVIVKIKANVNYIVVFGTKCIVDAKPIAKKVIRL